ncbi:MAG: amidohydrolase family protein [Ignavibacteriales bacterium]|nr:amidohydrolase family protein [Ignavibacteriales bacterium]
MNNRTYIDCYAMIGKRGPKDVEAAYETETLIDEMEWCGIHGALVAHSTAKEYDPIYGNRMLLRELKKSNRLYGVWAVMPHHTREFPKPKDVIQEMRDNDIRAAKMYPRVHRYPFTYDFCGDLLRELEKHEILLMLEGGHMYNPDIFEPSNQVLLSDLDALLTRFPNLNVLLQGSRWESTRYVYPLMMKHKKLHIELSAHQGNRAIEVFTEWYGVERILFGTGALEKSPGAAKAFVDYCTLNDNQKQTIAASSIQRLANIKTPPSPYKQKKFGDPILALAKEGKPLNNILVIDAYAHISHDGAEGIGFIHQPYGDAKSMYERAKLMGIDAMCISGFLAVWTDYEEGNKIVWDAMKRYPKFYHGYAALQPQYVKDWNKEFKLVYGKYKMEGLKPYHPRTGLLYNDKLWAPWFEYGNRMHAYTLIHPSPNLVKDIQDIAPKYPNMSFILAHSGASFHDARLAIEAAQNNPNVFLEITLTSVTYRVIEFMVRHVGADRVLFGTDQPMRDPIPQFGWMAYSHCSFEEKKKMFGLNMQKIIKRVKRAKR